MGYVEKDGITWAVTRGSPPQASKLEDMLSQVKSLYETKYGEDMDDEEDAEEEETPKKRVSLELLEEKLADVKTLYKNKYGQDVDDEDTPQEAETTRVQKDGITWVVTEGRGLSTTAAPKQEVLELEEHVAEVHNEHETQYVEKDG